MKGNDMTIVTMTLALEGCDVEDYGPVRLAKDFVTAYEYWAEPEFDIKVTGARVETPDPNNVVRKYERKFAESYHKRKVAAGQLHTCRCPECLR